MTALEDRISEQDRSHGLLAGWKADPGQIGLETLLREIDKLTPVRQLGVPVRNGPQPPFAAGEALDSVRAWRGN